MTREQIVQRQQELVTAARNEDRDLTPHEQAEFESLQRDLDNMHEESGNPSGPAEGAGEMRTFGQQPAAGSGQADLTLSPQQTAERAIQQERRRIADINELCRTFSVPADNYIRDGLTMDQVRTAVLNEIQRTGAPVNMRVTQDEGDKFRSQASDGMLLRAGIQTAQTTDGANQFRGMSLRDLAIECLTREGEDGMSLLRMDPSDMYGRLCREFYNPSAAFPAILDNTIRKSIVELYNRVPTTFQAWTTRGSLSDFKETPDHEYVIGGLGDFEEVPENGEIKPDIPRTEMMPSRKLKTYGKQFSMTRQAFINDDIGFLTRIPGLYATKAKMTIDKQVYSILFHNKKIFDGKPLFDASHGNLMDAGAKPSQTTIQKIILQMQKQKDHFGDAIYITPKWIIVPVGYEFDLAVILHSAQVVGSNNNDINPLYNYPIQIVQTPVLNALAGSKAAPWYMVADPMSALSIQVDYLNGQETPIVRRMEAAGTLGFTWDIYTDWGIAVRDFRGIAENPGEVIV